MGQNKKISRLEAWEAFNNQNEYVFDELDIGAALVSRDGNFLKVNQKLAEWLGYTVPQLEEKKFQDITHPEDLHDDLHAIQSVIDHKLDRYIMNKRYMPRLGGPKWARLKVIPIKNDDQEVLFFFSQIQGKEVNNEVSAELAVPLPNARKRDKVLSWCSDNPYKLFMIIVVLIPTLSSLFNWVYSEIAESIYEAWREKQRQVENDLPLRGE